MGCGHSKADDSPVVALCRERKTLIRDAADQRYAFAAAHADYLRVLAGVGDALHRFVHEELTLVPSPPTEITLPPSDGKGKSPESGGSSVTPLSHSLSGSGSGSHLHLSSDLELEESLKDSPEKNLSPEISSPDYYFMRSSSGIPTMVYENPYPWYSEYGVPTGLPEPAAEAPTPPPPPAEGSTWEFFDPFSSYEQYETNYSRERYGYGSVSSSTNSSQVREREGIPDLEDETEQESVKELKKESVKEAKKEKMVVDESSERQDFGAGTSNVKHEKEGMDDPIVSNQKESSKERSVGEEEGDSKDKGVIFEGESSMVTEDSGPSHENLSVAPSTRDAIDVVREMKELFESAASCGEEVSRMLEVGKLNYRAANRILRVISSRVLEPVGLSFFITSHPLFKRSWHPAGSVSKKKAGRTNVEKRISMNSGNLSSTLEKLYIWEKKLYKEVKDEEKLRIIYDRKCRRLRSLDDRGAESYKIDSIRASIRSLQTKISIIIKSVDAISRRMHKIRDEELQPQLIELIQGFIRMWKSMLECHQKQFQAIVSSKSHNLMAKIGVQEKSVVKATMQLELELLNWNSSFDDWINSQRSYIEALNGWLMKWLPQEQELTSDGVIPFSPSTIDAPAVFIISNDWYNALQRISEDEVSTAMHSFAVNVHKLWERQDEEQRQRLKAEYLSRDHAKRLKSLQESGMHGNLDVMSITDNSQVYHDDRMKDLDSMRKRLDEVRAKHEETVKVVQQTASTSLKMGLTPIFEALRDFTLVTLKAYEELRIPNRGGSS